MFCDTLPLQLLSKIYFFWFFWNGVDLPPSYLDNVCKYTGGFLDGTPKNADEFWNKSDFYMVDKDNHKKKKKQKGEERQRKMKSSSCWAQREVKKGRMGA